MVIDCGWCDRLSLARQAVVSVTSCDNGDRLRLA